MKAIMREYSIGAREMRDVPVEVVSFLMSPAHVAVDGYMQHTVDAVAYAVVIREDDGRFDQVVVSSLRLVRE